VLAGLAAVWLFFQTQNEHFLTARNLSNLVLQIGVLGTLAIGVVLVLLVGEIDLSLGAVTGVTAGILGVLLASLHWPSGAAIFAALIVGALIGALQGGVIVYVGVPSFIVTLAGFLAWQGVQIILLGSSGELLVQDSAIRSIGSSYLTTPQSVLLGFGVIALYAFDEWRRRIRRRANGLEVDGVARSVARVGLVALAVGGLAALLTAYLGVPYILVLLVGLVAILSWVTTRTVFGRHVYAIGGNAEAARRAGIRVDRVRIGIFVLTSMLAALGGVLSAARQFAVSIGTGGGTLQLDAIAAAVIGGTSLFGGRGRVYHALLGTLVIGSVENGLDLLGQPSSTKDIATGVILVIAVSIDALAQRRRRAR